MIRIKTLCILCCIITVTAMSGQNWTMKKGRIMTSFSKTIDTLNVLSEYPRPQMVRDNWVNLNGVWQFQAGKSASETMPTGDLSGKILVPFPVESAISGVMQHYERLWYRRMIRVPQEWKGKQILLHFGAVDYECEVFINGNSVGAPHTGGYDPFYFDITDFISEEKAEQELVVRVYDPTNKGGQPRGKQTLTPGGIMYTCTSGIWQTVWMEPVSKATAITSYKLIPNIDAENIKLNVVAGKGTATSKKVSVTIKEGEKVITTFDGNANRNLTIPIPSPKLWSPDSPFLYDIKIVLKGDDVAVDSISGYFGMRKISVAEEGGIKKMMLNNQFVFQMGPLDQGFWPDGLYTAPSDEALRYDIEMMKKLGFNMVRKHIKVEPLRWYYWCDKLGLMVWQDMPSANSYGSNMPDMDTKAYSSELTRMVKNLWNSPSIIMWVLFNEGQGQNECNTATLAGNVKTIDNSRLINQASGWYWKEVGDVLDAHHYPEPTCPSSTSQTLACGEYGGIVYTGLANSYRWNPNNTYGYTTAATLKDMEKLYDRYADQLVYYKSTQGLSAAVYTQITDVEVEINGLLSYDRSFVKGNIDSFYKSNRKAIEKEILTTDILPAAPIAPQTWKYTTDQPDATWNVKDFDDSTWKNGKSGFGVASTPGSVVNTVWNSTDIWLRKEFTINSSTETTLDSIWLYMHHDEDCEIYLNGVLAASFTGYTSNYFINEIANNAKKAIKLNETNVIAIHCKQTSGGQYIDAGLFRYSFTKTPITTINESRYTLLYNPDKESLQITGTQSDKANIYIYNLNGIQLIKGYSSQIDISELPKGLYFLTIQEGEFSQSMKFIR